MHRLTGTHGVSQKPAFLEIHPHDADALVLTEEDATVAAPRLRAVVDRAVTFLLLGLIPEGLDPADCMLTARGVVPEVQLGYREVV